MKRRAARYLPALAIILGVGLFVFGLSGWSYGGSTGPSGFRASAGLPQNSQYEATVGAVLVAAGILARRELL